ncbi:hypothetical protein DFS30_01395 [Akkermansia muciniphila]|nr:hypothetical protein CXT98_08655 [Akkermansia muciniphila]QAA63496.1 hypothetical protein C1O60_01405 [Akkermansia muciniphila]QAA65751.1 hypothetical protein C1O61_01445 [Akkermansia muciniphila]QAA68013.1 hypothetical protein C1O62_01395 [Akkermansia muciniphila]QHV22663.1 hypothetical protein C5O13_01375 [Akkermansia muciniphila]
MVFGGGGGLLPGDAFHAVAVPAEISGRCLLKAVKAFHAGRRQPGWKKAAVSGSRIHAADWGITPSNWL